MEQSRQFTRCMGRWLMTLVLVMLTSLATKAAEAYACYTPSNTTLTFYYDDQRSSRTGRTYDLPTGSNNPGWYTDGTNASVTKVVFNSSLAGARPTTTYRWFYEMTELTTITGIEYLNTSEVTNMSYMFVSCYKLTSVDVSHFNTSKVINMIGMFYDCKALTSLDLSSFNTSNVTKMYNMFQNCSSLRTVYVDSGWSTAAVTNSNNMFYNCTHLVGGQGTTYNASHVDKEYAHIDGGPSNPGYFTEKGPEAYACYTPSNTTLTFYYDNQRSSRTGTTYDLPTGSNNPGWYLDGTCSSVTRVVFDPSFTDARPTTTGCWFYKMQNLQSITAISNLNTSEVTNMSGMFMDCEKLTSLNLSGFNTAKVTSMSSMFYNCNRLTSLDLSNFNTAKVTSMSSMFYDCSRLTSLDLSNFNTANVTDMGMSYMFNNCQALTSLDVSSFNTSNVTDMSHMFNNCRSLTSLDVSSFNTSNVTNMTSMFSFCTALTTLDVSGFNTANVASMSFMFNNCRSLTSLDLSSFNTAKVITMFCMFDSCRGLTSLDLSSFNTAKVIEMQSMFCDCNNLTTIYVGNRWSTAAVSTSYNMFYNCTSLAGGHGTTYNANHVDATYAHIDGGPNYPGYFSLKGPKAYACYTPSNTTLTFYYDTQRSSRTGTTYDLNEGSNYPGWYQDGTYSSVTRVVFDPSLATARPTSTYYWFYYMQNLQTITGISYLNTSEVTNMSFMFISCRSLTSLDVSGFNTGNVTNTSFMFYDCSSLTSLDLSSFNTANVIYMCNMFDNCQALTSLNLSSFNTANVTRMDYMFTNCRSLPSLDVSNFNTAKVTDMSRMFANCWSLTSLDLSSFNSSKVTDMSYMFSNCDDLTTIYVGNEWSTAAVTESSDMFYNCTSLVGGQGTTFDANHVDKAYAHIDGGAYYPGYFSRLIRGDVNHDGAVDVADVTALIAIILNSQPVDYAVADMNDDDEVDVADVTSLIAFILSN